MRPEVQVSEAWRGELVPLLVVVRDVLLRLSRLGSVADASRSGV